jgi:hypothetical protein
VPAPSATSPSALAPVLVLASALVPATALAKWKATRVGFDRQSLVSSGFNDAAAAAEVAATMATPLAAPAPPSPPLQFLLISITQHAVISMPQHKFVISMPQHEFVNCSIRN